MKHRFRALLLAAGLGTRLRPITLQTPKCLLPVAGEPLLGRWLRQLEFAGCEAVLVNTHYLADQVKVFLDEWPMSAMKILMTHEPQLLGTAGTLIANHAFFERSTCVVIHADNAMAGDLQDFMAAHLSRSSNCYLTMLTFNTDHPSSCGIVLADSNGVVSGFHEKIANPPGNCANGALYAFEASFLDRLVGLTPSPNDFSTEVIPKFLGRIQTWHTDLPYIDIGTPVGLANAQAMTPIL